MKSPVNFSLLCLSVLLIWFFSHVPFFSSDADLSASPGSRGAWTDEGLYSGQIRNFINHNSFDILEGDAFLKTPLFSACLFVPLKLLGTHLEVARGTMLILLTLSLFIFYLFKPFRLTFLILMLTTLMLFSIHQHSHLALAEMFAVSLILVAGVIYVRYRATRKTGLLLSTFSVLVIPVLLKLQFIYVLAIPSLTIIIENYSDRKPILNRQLLLSVLAFFSVCLIFFLVWYVPFKSEFVQLSKQQAGNFTFDKISFHYLIINVYGHFFNKGIIFFTLCYTAALLLAVKWLIKNSISPTFRSLLIFAIVWNIVELHKLPMEYLPVRYLVSLYFSMGLTISIVLAHLLSTEHKLIFKAGSIAAIGILITINLFDYYRTFKRRTFVIAELNHYFAHYDLKDKTIIGSWAPSLTWESGSISFPVWKNFIQTSTPLKTFKPAIVVSEGDEEDSEKTFSGNGIDLAAVSDSVKKTKIAYWNVNIYWINQQKIKN